MSLKRGGGSLEGPPGKADMRAQSSESATGSRVTGKTTGAPGGDDERWTLIIRPKRKWLDINLAEIIHYRDLIRLFVSRDFVSVYKQTILGPLWFVLSPLFTTIVYTVVFNGLAKIPTDGVPPTLFYYGGTMMWGYFSTSLTTAADIFTGNSALFGKVYFPRLTVPIAKALYNLLTVAIQLATLAAFYLYYALTGSPVRPTALALCFPLVLIQVAAIGTGFGMVVSALTTRYRDLRQLVGFGVTLWMYATPIVYPLSQVPEKYRWAMVFNPVTAPIEVFRAGFYGVPGPSALLVLTSIGATAVLLFVGLVLFGRNERTFVDVV